MADPATLFLPNEANEFTFDPGALSPCVRLKIKM
jgi:hypothetical protein